MDQSSFIQNRRSARSPVLLSATVDVAGADVSVILRNLSSEGALIEGTQLPHEGATTVFTRKELRVKGRVAWVHGHLAGVAFDRELEPAELLRQVPRPRQRFEPQFRRPGLACEPLTASDRKMLESWATAAPVRRPGD
jgi:hypothetical protein